jgi:hypothetical protein
MKYTASEYIQHPYRAWSDFKFFYKKWDWIVVARSHKKKESGKILENRGGLSWGCPI